MDHEDVPNFSYAYAGRSTPPPPSWNPALRPDHEEPRRAAPIAKSTDSRRETLLQSQSYPEASPAEDDEGRDEEDDLASPAVASVPSGQHGLYAEHNSGDDFFDRDGASHVAQPPAQHPEGPINGHGDSGAEEDHLVNGVQSMGLADQPLESESHGTEDPSEPSRDAFFEEKGADSGAAEAYQVENYEHQGESTLLEDAISEGVKMPLVQDAEPSTDDWDASGEVFDLGGQPQDAPLSTSEEAPLPTPQAEAMGTTAGDDFIGNTTVGGNTGEDDWGNGEGEDVDLFGGAVSQGASGGDGAVDKGSEWDLSLDDDFLEENDEAPAPFDLGDDEGFLEDEQPEPVQQPPQPIQNKYAPQVAHVPQPAAATPYGLPSPQFTDFSQLNQQKPAATPNAAYGAYGQPSPYQQQPARPAMSSSAQSFADKSKGGYSSPYDLPEDVVTTRRRPAPRPSVGPSGQPVQPPPPRSSSVYSNPGAVVPPPPIPSNMSASSLSPPSSSQSNQASMTGMHPPPKPAPAKAPSSDFFAELPITSKPKPPGRYTPQPVAPQHSLPHAPPQVLPKERTSSWSSLRNEVLPDSPNLAAPLREPERLPVFPDQPSVPVRSNSVPMPPPGPASVLPPRYSPQPPPSAPPAKTRYSPAPPTPGTTGRYSPAPPPQAQVQNRYASEPSPGLPKPPVQPYAPRTSSPLAFHTQSNEQQARPNPPEQEGQGHNHMLSADSIPRVPYKSPLPGVNEIEENTQGGTQPSAPPMANRSETPPLRSGPSSTVGSPRKKSNYTPQYQPGFQPTASGVQSPGLPLSRSPESTIKSPPLRHSQTDQPGPTYGYPPSTSSFGAQGAPAGAATLNVIPHKRQASHDFDYIPPTDERASDHLERWKGHPIFTWGLGGAVVTSFPRQIPRYGGGNSMPMLKCSPGEVKIQNVKELFPLPEEVAKFPGPLKAKGKKKEVSAWLGKRIETLENQLQSPGFEHSVSAADFKRLEEKVLLWKILQVLVDNDGHLEGNATAEEAVRKVLAPEGLASADSDASIPTAADLVSGRPRSNTAVQAEPIDPKALEELRTYLTKGEREKAVWHAVDQRLWAHAMLLSSTLDKDVWKQVVQEFVRKEVKKIGRDNQALAVLYEIFAGNWDDCIDELVPASARAGFQMVSTDGAGPTQNALQGLDKWRETLSLVLNNRSTGDTAALLSLGRLLAGYGRVEAAHICFIFGRPAAHVSGVDDPQSDMVLVGADHRAYPLELGNEIEPILLTEVYEFALSLSAPSGSYTIPHLQNYKLVHAYALAEYGYRADAQAYCDVIATAMKSTTKISPYYNGSFVANLDDLSKRLSQSPKDSSSWISKPSMDKVSSSLLSKFNSFIAGDDDDAASTHSGGGEAGPFSRIAGNTPSISPAQSSADLYGAYSGMGGMSASASASMNSRYAPRTSVEQTRSSYESQGRPSMDSQPSNPYMPSPAPSGPYTPSQPQFSPGIQRTDISKQQSYAPLKNSGAAASSYGSPYQPTPPVEEATPSYGGYQPHQANFDQPPSPPAEAAHTSNSYEPPTSYAPPTSSYEPPSYEPYNPDPEPDSPEDSAPRKKKSFLDDDEDDAAELARRAAALKSNSKSKSEADRIADEAFRKAAEADAQRDKQNQNNKKGGGWLSGWFKKGDANGMPTQSSGPIKAKLGEENSFYYDTELKKWVNKKAGAGGAGEASSARATPPPPKGGPPGRSVSEMGASAGGLGSSLPNSSAHMNPALRSLPPTSNPQRSSSMPPPMMSPTGAPGSRASTPGIPSGDEGAGKAPPLTRPPLVAGAGPPSRPGTGMSNASSIDDLLGAPTAKKGTVKGKKRGGRYVDVMAQGM